MRNKIRSLVRQKNKAVEALDNAIYDELDFQARKCSLDRMIITAYGNTYERDGKVVRERDLIRLDELIELYADEVHPGGMEGLWTPEKGWH